MMITDALNSVLGISKKSCPDCGAPLMPDGCCGECGYGEEEEEGEDEGDEEETTSMLLEIRDELDRLKRKLDKLITKS